jgi:hypothetical protein
MSMVQQPFQRRLQQVFPVRPAPGQGDRGSQEMIAPLGQQPVQVRILGLPSHRHHLQIA